MKILLEDYELLKTRLEEISKELKDLAPEFKEALNQSTETWHDNSPWDDAKLRERILLTEQDQLRKVFRECEVVKLNKEKYIGKRHKLRYGGQDKLIYLAGDFTMCPGQKVDGHTIVTTSSPIAQQIIK